MVRTDNIRKSFWDSKTGETKAVDGVNIEAHPGKIFGLLGANGAGKTTLLRMLATVISPTSGTASVDGFDIVKEPEMVRAHIGFLSNSTALYGRLTAREVLEYFGALYGLRGSRLKERMDYVIHKLQIEEFVDRLCDKLSTGQKQRVSISRAILHDPPVLILDEPTAGLDVVISQTIMEFIEEQREQGRTIVFSTHVMSEAERLCDNIAVIHDGSICGEGTLEQILQAANTDRLESAFLKMVGYRREVSA
ncbi:MAG TPA: ATP-binding cassette domain-containing protein [Fimbriimonadaceae bacterium]|nr:ATP-binding cassette domain-containing protein [Fimbriimonadaceae bacterium]